jgi:hypothetical protein
LLAFWSEKLYTISDEVNKMKREIYIDKIKDRIKSGIQGEIYITSDFFDIADVNVVNKALSRLEKERFIRRIIRGVYEYPQYNAFLKEFVAPSPNRVAQAIARNYGWKIVPNGDTALNMLGLSTQVPTIWSYVSDGTYKKYTFDNIILQFKRTTNKEIANLSSKTALIVQSLKDLGKNKINGEIGNKISHLLTSDEKKIVLKETQHSTTWIYETLKDICKEEKYE